MDSFIDDREKYIIHLLELNSRMSISELCHIFNVAPSTMRRQLADMEERGLLIRTHGGAISVDHDRDQPVEVKSDINKFYKEEIARVARTCVSDGDTLAIGGGTTTMEFARLLHDLKGSIVFTDSIMAANELMNNKNIEVRICSGIVKSRSGCVVGPNTEHFFDSVHVDKAFVGADTVSVDGEAFVTNILVSQVESRMLECADRVFLLCDYSKLGKNDIFLLRRLTAERGDVLITDSYADVRFVGDLRRRGVTVMMDTE